MRVIAVIILSALLGCSLHAQSGDCVNAVLVEDKSQYKIVIDQADNEIEDDVFWENCMDISMSSNFEGDVPTHWLKWKVLEGGTLTFDISMNLEEYDIDFVLYKSTSEEESCANLEPIRCMFSGNNVQNGEILPSIPCTESTGLSAIDTDVSEGSGCAEGNNNYVRYLDAETSATYYLLILNFSDILDTVTIDFCGSAILGEADEVCEIPELLPVNEMIRKEVIIGPNPARSTFTLYNFNQEDLINADFNVIDVNGNIKMVDFISEENIELNLSTYESGMYFIFYNLNGRSEILRFLKI